MAALYAAVGHGGASGYLAVLTLLSWGGPAEVATTALVLNLVVASVAAVAFARGGYFSCKVLWPFLVTSVPAAFLGGYFTANSKVYYLLLAVSLVAAAVRLILPARNARDREPRPPKVAYALVTGFAIGLISGIVGVGGGIFLSPVLIFAYWADAKTAAAVSAVFIVVNSFAALAARFIAGSLAAGPLWFPLGAAFAGGAFGSYLGARRLNPAALKTLLGVVLFAASAKAIMKLF